MSKLHSTAFAVPMAAVRDSELPERALTREMQIEVRAESVNVEARTVELSFSSEAAVQRWWGSEILDHGGKSIRLGRLNGGAALLMDHNTRDQVGVVEKASVKGKVGRALVRFGRSARAEEIFQDVQDGIRKLVSVGYNIFEVVLEKTNQSEGETYRVTDWEPFEISLVSVPADNSVGVGRDGQTPSFDPRTLLNEEEDEMFRQTRDAAGASPSPAPFAQPAPVEQRAAPAPVAAQPVAAPAPDLDAVRRDERDRSANIRALGARMNVAADAVDAAIADGRSVEAFVRTINEIVPATQAIRTAENPAIGMSDREVNRYSFVRMFHALANPTDAGAQRAAAFEMECSQAAIAAGQQQQRSNGALRIPQDVLVTGLRHAVGQAEQRDLVVGTATAGGHTVATDLLASSFIDLLRNAMALEQVGARMLTDLNGNIAIPRQTGGATAYWVGESGASTESQQAFDQVALSPKTVTGYTDISRQLLLQSSIDVEAFVRQDLAITLGLEIDRAGINGSGSSNQPRGIMQTSGIGSVAGGTNGAAPTWDNMIDLETAIGTANAMMGNLAYLTNAKARGKLKRTQKFASTNGDPIWERDNTMNGYRAAVSNQMPANLTKGSASGICSAILFGNFADVLIGMWGGLDVLVNPYILSGTGTVRIEVYQSVDVALRHPESFSAMLDALTT